MFRFIRLFLVLFIFIFLTGNSQLFAQEFDYVKTNSARESLKIAQTFINQKEYVKAKKQLKHTLKIKKNFAVAYRELGKVQMELDEYADAAMTYEESFDLNSKISRAAFFECAEAFFKSNDIQKALYYYKKYKDLKGTKYTNKKKESGLETTYDKLLAVRESNCYYMLNMDAESTPYAYAESLGENINTPKDEYLPTVVNAGQRLVYTQRAKGKDEDIMVSTMNNNAEWKKGRKIGYKINTDKNEGMAKFATHGKTFYYAGCERTDTEGGCDIYEAELVDGEVSQTNRMEGLNSTWWDSQPSISCDGQWMYFSSNRPGGKGGADIWLSELQSDGEWGEASNLGEGVNTEFDEESPFIATDGQTLYFSSDGHEGMGDGDLFISRKNEEEIWSKAQNMGIPFNSQCKELGIFIQADGKTAHFASSRFGGKGGLDLYKTVLPPGYRPLEMMSVEGMIIDAETQEPISTEITISRKGSKQVLKSDEKGWFFTCLVGNKGYSFQVKERGYEQFSSAVFLPMNNSQQSTPVLVKLEKPKPKARPVIRKIQAKKPETNPSEKRTIRVLVYFDFDSDELKKLDQKRLNNIIKMLQKENDWNVIVVGYTDNIGNAQYNKELSERRANSVVDYLNGGGVTIDNIIKKEGKGAIGIEKEEARKRLNRRVEVILTK